MSWRDLQEKAMEATLLRILKRQLKDVLAEFEKTQIVLDDLFWDEQERLMRNAVRPILADIYQTGSSKPVNVITGKGLFDSIADLASSAGRWARGYALTLVADITDTSRKFVDGVIAEYFAEPTLTIKDISKLLEPRFGQTTAEMIAVTETTKAYHEGATETANEIRSAGLNLIGIWYTAADDRVCPICGPLEGVKETTPGSNQWPHPDLGLIPGPPAHPRCRCDVGFEMA